MMSFGRARPAGPVAALVGGIIFAGAGLALVYFMGSDYTLVCNRIDDTCVVQLDNVFRGEETVITLNLSDLEKAELRESRDGKGKSVYQVMLITPQLAVPLGDVPSNQFSTSNKLVTEINGYLNAPSDGEFRVKQSELFLRMIGFAFAAVGGLVLLGSLGRLLKLLLIPILLLKK